MKSTAVQIHSYKDFFTVYSGTEKLVSNHAKKMGLIGMSCVAIALAGLLSRTSLTADDQIESAATTIPSAPMAQPLEPVRAESGALNAPKHSNAKPAVTREVRFAQKQLRLYTGLSESLQLRMNEEPNVDHLTRMRAALASLNENLEESRTALATYRAHQNPFNTEGLKEQLFALQESGQKAVSVFVDADNFPNEENLQLFKVSRTGQ